MPTMDIDELMKYIDADDDKKDNLKGKSKKSTQRNNLKKGNRSTSNNNANNANNANNNNNNTNTVNGNNNGKFAEDYRYITENNENASLNRNDDRFTERELEEFKLKILRDSVKCGQFSKFKPRFSEDWIQELL